MIRFLDIILSLFLPLLYLGMLEYSDNLTYGSKGEVLLFVHSGRYPSRKASPVSSISESALLVHAFFFWNVMACDN